MCTFLYRSAIVSFIFYSCIKLLNFYLFADISIYLFSNLVINFFIYLIL